MILGFSVLFIPLIMVQFGGMEGDIILPEVLKQMRQLDETGRAVPFSIAIRTFNSNTKKGGKVNRYKKAKLVMQEKVQPKNCTKALMYHTKRTINPKNPNHWENKTRNIKVFPEMNIVKINILDIIEFNGQKVIY